MIYYYSNYIQISKLAKERNKLDRDNFVIRMSQYIPSQLVFSDESAYDRRTLSCRYGWSFSGLRAQNYTFFVRGKRFTIEGALCIDGLLAYSIQEGSMNTKDYDDFIEHVLVIILILLSIYLLILLFTICTIILIKYFNIVTKNEFISWTI
jgi:hypothetical protein